MGRLPSARRHRGSEAARLLATSEGNGERTARLLGPRRALRVRGVSSGSAIASCGYDSPAHFPSGREVESRENGKGVALLRARVGGLITATYPLPPKAEEFFTTTGGAALTLAERITQAVASSWTTSPMTGGGT